MNNDIVVSSIFHSKMYTHMYNEGRHFFRYL